MEFWDSTEHQHRGSGIPCPQALSQQVSSILYVSGLLGVSNRNSSVFWPTFLRPSEFQIGVTCIMVSEHTSLPIHHLLVVLLDTCMFVCCSSATRDLETVGCPRAGSHHPTHEAMICSDVNIRNFSSAVLVVLEVVLVLQGWCVLLAKNCISILLRSRSALLCCIGSPAHVKITASTALGQTSARGHDRPRSVDVDQHPPEPNTQIQLHCADL